MSLLTEVVKALKGKLQPKIIFCLLTSFSTKAGRGRSNVILHIGEVSKTAVGRLPFVAPPGGRTICDVVDSAICRPKQEDQ